MLDLTRPTFLADRGTHRADPHHSNDDAEAYAARPVRVATAAFTAATVALVLIGAAAGDSAARGVGATLFFTIGVGSAIASLIAGLTLAAYLFTSIVASLTITLLAGFTLAETHFWHPGLAFGVLVVAAAAGYVVALRRDGGRPLLPSRADVVARLRPAALPLAASLVGLALVIAACLLHSGSYASYYGAFGRLGPLWYAGVALVALAVPLALRAPGRGVAGLSTVVLAVALALTPALLYRYPTVTSAARHVGVAQVMRHIGGVDLSQGIYHRWPALFAGAGMMWDVGDVTNPFAWARWWPVLINPAATLGVFVLARRVLAGRAVVPTHRLWGAAALFTVANVLGNAYFSPQSTCFVLALAVLALAIPQGGAERPTVRPAALVALTVAGFAITVTHQLTPYLVLLALVVLVLARLVRPWWTTLLIGVPAVGWAALNYSVLQQYVNLGVLGHATSNAAPPRHGGHLGYARLTDVVIGTPLLLFLAVGVAAVVAALRRNDRLGWALLACAASPALLFLGNNYGNEALFRAGLFALPWLVTLVACAPHRGERTARARAVGTVAALLAGTLVFCVGTYGLDWYRVIRPGTVRAVTRFEQTAPRKSVLVITGSGNATPGRLTDRSPDVNYIARDTIRDLPATRHYDPQRDIATLTALLTRASPTTSYYLLVSTETGAYDALYGIQRYGDYQKLGVALRSSTYWKPVDRTHSATLYRLDVPAYRAARARGGGG